MRSIGLTLCNRRFLLSCGVVLGSLTVIAFSSIAAVRGTRPPGAATAREIAQPGELRAYNLTPEQRELKLAAVNDSRSFVGGGLPNDDCGGALPIGNGTSSFSTVGASADGPALPTSCEEGAGLAFGQDIWFCYTADCPPSGTVTVRLCGSSYDTRMAVYSGCVCPATNTGLVACNDDSCGLASEVSFSATSGEQFLIRVGGFGTASGTGTMSIACTGACSVTCPAGGVQEGEPVCFNDYADNFNGGCNATPPVFSPLNCGETVCGTYGTYLSGVDQYRDTDFYVFSTAGGPVTWSATGEATTRVVLVQPTPDCTNLTVLGTMAAGPCHAAAVTVTVGPGTYYAFVATDAFTGVACGGGYTAQLACAPPPACTPLPVDSNGVMPYACNCYDRLGITAEQFETEVGGIYINCAINGVQLYTTENGTIRDINTNGAPNSHAAADFPPTCDRPAWLSSKCYGNTVICTWEITATAPRPGKSKVTIALLCRHKTVWSADPFKFDDIAMIMHNRDSGETCWFQSPEGRIPESEPPRSYELDGTEIPVPHITDATALWLKPSETAAKDCIKCHDNGPWMNSRWMFNSEIELKDERGLYKNKGAEFSTKWKEPKFVSIDAEGLADEIKHNSCTSCHRIHSGETDDFWGGRTCEKWLGFTVGLRPYPTPSNATGQAFDIAYWMPPQSRDLPGSMTVDAANADDWAEKYQTHVCMLQACCHRKGENLGNGDPCHVVKVEGGRGTPARSLIPGVHLYADTDDDGAWDYESAAPSDPAAPPITISSGTPLSVGWSADADHLNCFIAATFPAGVAVYDPGNGSTTGTGTNWLLSESPQTIGILTVPGDYYFHIDCDDDDYDQISASLTFQVPGPSPTVLRVEAIVNTNGTMAFDYPSPAEPHVVLPIAATSTVHIAWMAYNVVAGSCELRETFDPPSGPAPSTFPEESGFMSVPLYGNTDQNYRLTCTGNDGQTHAVDVTLHVQPGVPGDCDGDGDLGLADWSCLASCLTGPSVSYAAGCGAFDFYGDGDVDLEDAAAFMRLFTPTGG